MFLIGPLDQFIFIKIFQLHILISGSIGYFNPSQAVDILTMKTPHTYVTSFAALQDASNYRLDNN